VLDFLSRLSIKLQPLRKLSYVLGAIFITVIISQLFQKPAQLHQVDNSYTILSFVSCIWLLLFNILILTFKEVPSVNKVTSGIISRFKIKVQRAFYHLLALLFVGLSLTIIILTIRLLRI
jgi:hypothetical protein